MNHRNKNEWRQYELNYIMENYVKAKKPLTQQQIADNLGISLGALKNFMYLHNLNKKKTYSKRNEEIKKNYESGIPVKKISKKYGFSTQNIYRILGE